MDNSALETIKHEDAVIALILRADVSPEGINFLTPDDYSLQMGQMRHPAGYVIQPHRHTPKPRKVELTREAVLVRKGRVRVDLYTPDEEFLTSRELNAGDVILLHNGGHGFEMLEESDMVEIKQGPFPGPDDKVRF